MSEIKITGSNSPQEISGIKLEKQCSSKGFDKFMREAINEISNIQEEAERAVKELASGGDVIQAVIAMEKADMSFQLMIEVRNKLLNAYDEIMRMQV
ncbi:MAG: flagellar hook-basal body complex protein FliE [Nitrospirae bacterium]|nr:flagellar hook-basal body complex protein FliE [Nitrospirota bacterium]